MTTIIPATSACVTNWSSRFKGFHLTRSDARGPRETQRLQLPRHPPQDDSPGRKKLNRQLTLTNHSYPTQIFGPKPLRSNLSNRYFQKETRRKWPLHRLRSLSSVCL